MKPKKAAKILSLVLTLMVVLPFLISASSHLQTTPTVTEGEVWVGPLAGDSTDPGDPLNLTSGSLIPTNPILSDYLKAYHQAKSLLDIGIEFRSMELQRLDPSTCETEPENPEACSFSVTGIQNNYLDFKDGRLYWRFCADYDEPYVGPNAVEEAVDDPGDLLQLDRYGYCPTWVALDNGQKTRRVSSWQATDLDKTPDSPSQSVEINIRNQMLDAQRIFAYMAVAEPANATFNGDNYLDALTVNEAGALIEGSDGQPDRIRDVGTFYLLEVTRELANVHMIFGNEFMVDALRFPFSTDGTDTEQLVRAEQQKLERALYQYSLAIEVLIYALNYNLSGGEGTYAADFFTERELQLFAAASERTVTALTEIAKRDRLLGSDSLAADQAALARLNNSFLDQYLQGLALSYQATSLIEDDPTTLDIDESKLHFLDNSGRDIMNNLHRLVQQTQNIRSGLNPLGYEDTFVPLKLFPDLLDLACGGQTTCTQNAGLLNSAYLAGADLENSQRTFDEWRRFELKKSGLNK